MFVQIRHTTRFAYSSPAWCDPMVLRLRPRDDPAQRLLDFELTVAPQPAGRADWLDADGNRATCIWFDDPLPGLEIRTASTVETLRENPYDFLLHIAAKRVPLCFNGSEQHLVEYFAAPSALSPSVADLAQRTLAATDGQTIPFLNELCARVHREVATTIRLTGDAWPAEKTLTERRGACRDLAVLFNEACRCVGLPARFVSGYAHGNGALQEHHLHAWSEVYLPGGGWRGFDASIGSAVADQHVAVAASRDPSGAAPAVGTFTGIGVTSQVTAFVELEAGRSVVRAGL